MNQLKEVFTFIHLTSEKTINVELMGNVYCAIFDTKPMPTAKALIIAIDGAIYLRETAKLLGHVPEEAYSNEILFKNLKITINEVSK